MSVLFIDKDIVYIINTQYMEAQNIHVFTFQFLFDF